MGCLKLEPGNFLTTEKVGVEPIEVYFDDFKVTHIKSPVIQSDEYYPFGLTFNSYQRENSVPNRWKFQGQEHIDDLDLGWDSFKWRNHQPDIGRFFNVDPLAEDYYYNSPYAFSENKVTSHIELEGLEAVPFGAGTNPLQTITTGASNFFREAGKFIDRASVSVSGKASRIISQTKVNLGIASASLTKSFDVTNTTTAKPTLGEFFTPNTTSNEPGGDVGKIKNETSAAINMTVSAQATVEGLDVSTTNNTSIDNDKNVVNTSNVTIGKNGSGAFLDKKISSDGTKTDIGVKSSGSVQVGKTNFSLTIKASITIDEEKRK